MKPRLLDLFCGAGGAGVGYFRAGFDVVGVDKNPQRSYPFEFHQADAIEYLQSHWREFDVIHASPPCQSYTNIRNLVESRLGKQDYPDLVEPTRNALRATGKPYIIENVPGAPLENPIVLCGVMFDLKVFRHRLFETSFPVLAPVHKHHPRNSTTNAYRGQSAFEFGATHINVCGANFRFDDAKKAMGIDWMRIRKEISQAIPPAYTEFLGSLAMACLTPRAADALLAPSNGLFFQPELIPVSMAGSLAHR